MSLKDQKQIADLNGGFSGCSFACRQIRSHFPHYNLIVQVLQFELLILSIFISFGYLLPEKSFGNLLQRKKEVSPFDGNKHVEMISNSMKEDHENEEMEMQWKHASNILARFMSIIYIVAITITFFATIVVGREYADGFPNKH